MCVSSSWSSQNIEPSTSYSSGNFTSDNNQVELNDWAMVVTQEITHTKMGKSELDLYLGELNHSRTKDLDILDYWFKTSIRYPTLAVIARDLITIPISTLASESTFSTGGKTITLTGSLLKPKSEDNASFDLSSELDASDG